MNRLVKTFRKQGNAVKETTKVVEQPKQPHTLPDGSTNPEFIVSNPRSKDYGKKMKDTVSYQMNYKKVEVKPRSEPTFEDEEELTPKEQPRKNYPVQFWGGRKVEANLDNVTFNEFSITETNNISKVPPVHLVKQGYYLLFDSNRVYVLRDTQAASRGRNTSYKCVPHILKKSAKVDSTSARIYSGNIVNYNDLRKDYTDLTRDDYNSIVKSTPSIEDLLSVYVLFNNAEEVEMNKSIAQIVW